MITPAPDSPYIVIIYIALLLDMVLKGIAMWKAARDNRKYWFISLLVINSVGLFPLAYLLFFAKKKSDKVNESGK